jgi:hypothetical protein
LYRPPGRHSSENSLEQHLGEQLHRWFRQCHQHRRLPQHGEGDELPERHGAQRAGAVLDEVAEEIAQVPANDSAEGMES